MTKKDSSKRQVIVLDNDDFYGLTLDMVLFNFGLDSSVKVHTKRDYDQFVKDLSAGKFKKAIYILDEHYGWGKVDIGKVIDSIKSKDKDAVFICYTVSDEKTDEILNKDLFDYVVLKTGLDDERSLIKSLSDILGIEFVADNSDPEFESK